MPIDYFSLIHKYLPPSSKAYRLYVPHVALVTARSLKIARCMGLSQERLNFLEEAAMLHDIGICRVDEPRLACQGSLPYLAHGVAGRKILESEGLPEHALLAERHVGVGISGEEIRQYQLPLPERDMLPLSREEKILAWSDLFYSKLPTQLWQERPLAQVEEKVRSYGPQSWQRFQKLKEEIAPYDPLLHGG